MFGGTFGNTSNTFGSPAPAAGGFGGGGGGFGTPANTGGGFGNTNTTTTPGFGGNTGGGFGTNTGGGFGTNTGGFGNTNTTGGFGAPASSPFGATGNTAAGGGFGTNTAGGGFGTNTTGGFGATNNTFGATNTNNTFGANTNNNAGGMFGATNNNAGGFGANTAGGFGANNAGGQTGTGNPAWSKTRGEMAGEQYMAITAMPAYISKSIEELRFEDYMRGNKPGGGGFGAAPNTGMGGNTNTFGQPAGSPFGANNTANTGGGGLFGNTNTATNNAGGGGMFGNTNNAGGGMFGNTNTTNNAFGANNTNTAFGANNTNNAGGGMFGNTANNNAGGGGLFGNTNTTNTAGGGMFGNTNTTNNAGGGMFGNTANTNTGGGGLFGNTNTTNNAGGGMFGNTNTTNNAGGGMFGNTNTTNNAGGGMFGNTNTGGGGGLFGNTNTTNNAGGGLFGNNNNAKPAGGGLFGNTNTGGGGGLFGNTANTNTGGGLFGNTNNNKPATGGGLFGNTNTGGGGGLFGGNTNTGGGGLFGNTNNNNTGGGGLFGNTNNNNTGGGGLFGNTNNNTSGGGLFGNTNTNTAGGGLFGNNNNNAGAQMGGNNAQAVQLASVAPPVPYAGGANSQMARHVRLAQEAWKPVANGEGNAKSEGEKASGAGTTKPGDARTRSMAPTGGSIKIRPRGYGRGYGTLVTVKSGMNGMDRASRMAENGNVGRQAIDKQINVLSPGVFDLNKRLAIKKSGRKAPGSASKVLALEDRGNRNDDETPRKVPELMDGAPNSGAAKSSTTKQLFIGGRSPVVDHDGEEATPSGGSDTPNPRKNLASSLANGGKSSDEEDDGFVVLKSRNASKSAEVAPRSKLCPTICDAYLDVGYSVTPSLDKLRGMTDKELSQVKDFAVSRVNFGTVTWLGAVDIRGLVIDDVVEITTQSIEVYKDGRGTPPRGEGLNKPALCKIEQMEKPIEFSGTDEEFKAWIKQYTNEELDATFIDYEAETKVWVFKVEHFTKYSFANAFAKQDQQSVSGEANSNSFQCQGPSSTSAVPDSRPQEEQPAAITTEPGNLFQRYGPSSASATLDSRPFAADDESSAAPLDHHDMMSWEQQQSEGNTFLTNGAATPHRNGFSRGGATVNVTPFRPHPARAPAGGAAPTPAAMFEAPRIRASASIVAAPVHVTALVNHDATASAEDRRAHLEQNKRIHSKFTREDSPTLRLFEEATEQLNQQQPKRRPMCLNRSFRVSWGPNGELVHCGIPVSKNLNPNDTIVIGRTAVLERVSTTSSKQIVEANLDCHLQSCVNASEEGSMDDNMMDNDDRQGRDDWVALLHKYISRTEVDLGAAAQHNTPSPATARLVHESRTWKLVNALWGETFAHSESMMKLQQQQSKSMKECTPNTTSKCVDYPVIVDEDAPSKQVRVQQESLESVNLWFRAVIDELDRASGGDEDALTFEGAEVELNLTAGRLEYACERATDLGDLRMATLLSQARGDVKVRELLRKQLDVWVRQDAKGLMEESRLNLFQILAGDVVGRHRREESWIRSLALHLWQHCPPLSPLKRSVESFRGVVWDTSARNQSLVPLPHYLSAAEITSPTVEEGLIASVHGLDTLYHLFCLASEHELYPVSKVLEPAGHTADVLDYSLAWHMNELFRGMRIFGAMLGPSPSQRLQMNFIFQLETLDLWHWGVYVAHQLPSPYNEQVIVELLSRHCPDAKDQANSAALVFVEKVLGVPNKWIAKALSYKAKYEFDMKEQMAQAIAGQEWAALNTLLFTRLGPITVIDGDLDVYLRVLGTAKSNGFDPSLIPTWSVDGGLYELYAELRSLVENPSASVGADQILEGIKSFSECLRQRKRIIDNEQVTGSGDTADVGKSHMSVEFHQSIAEMGAWLQGAWFSIADIVPDEYKFSLSEEVAVIPSLPSRYDTHQAVLSKLTSKFLNQFVIPIEAQ